MMRTEDLLREALKLPPEQREELAAALVASCEDEPDAHVEGAWKSEIERRARAGLRSGWASSRDWTVVRTELLGRRPKE